MYSLLILYYILKRVWVAHSVNCLATSWTPDRDVLFSRYRRPFPCIKLTTHFHLLSRVRII
jgi:hypothetical protein